VAYGCLAPLEFNAVPWPDAWGRYHPIAALDPGPFSRTDFTANVLLFAPLGFLWAGVAGAGAQRWGGVLRSVAVGAAAVLAQALFEFLQIYTPYRNVSVWDVLAGGTGAAIGIIGWWIAGSRTRRTLDRWKFVRGGEGVAGWLLAPYVLVLLIWNLFPLDLTLDPSALLAKWSRGLITPIPFSNFGGDPVGATLGLLGESLAWLPLAGILVLSGRSGRFVAWCATLLLALAVEAVQLLVQSRVSDTATLIGAGAGAAAGAMIGGGFRRRHAETAGDHPEGRAARTMWASFLAASLWSVVLFVACLYPFDFEYLPREIPGRLAGLFAVPFQIHGAVAAPRALLQVVLFTPFGVAAAAAASRRGRRFAWIAGTAAAVGAAGVASLIEGGQVFLSSNVVESADVLLAGVGAIIGFTGARIIGRVAFGQEHV
jgi:glycopeptide antibiotics resistance protein